MSSERTPTDQLRNRIISELHIGHLRPGDRLPSIREVSGDLDADHRAIAQAYRKLEVEGLIELRGRTGAYVAAQDRLGGELMEETARWLAGMLVEGRKRRVMVPGLPEFIRRCTSRVRVRSACIESAEDEMTVLCTELAEDFGFVSSPVFVDQLLESKNGTDALPTEVRGADLLVTTHFHAQPVTEIANTLNKPLVITTVAPELASVIERRLRNETLTVIVADAQYGERFRTVYGTRSSRPNAIRVVLASDSQAIARLDRLDPILVTRAARRRLPDLDIPLLLPRYPSISTESGREIAEHLIRLNLEAAETRT